MSQDLKSFEYSSPLGLWKGALFKKKLCYLSQGGDFLLQKFAQSLPLKLQKGRIPTLLQKELDLYFRGELRKFTYPICFLEGTPFQKKVWECLLQIPYGEVKSYAWVAKRIRQPKAMRAVGNSNGKNKIPIVIPCHRVIHASGHLGGYSGGQAIKKALLKIEGMKF